MCGTVAFDVGRSAARNKVEALQTKERVSGEKPGGSF